MANKKGSCLKRAAFGCGGIIVLFIMFGVMVGVGAMMNKPDPEDVVELNTVQSFETISEGGLNLPESERPNQKPVRLVLDMEMTQLEVLPGSQKGRIEIGGDYDKANYELTTKVLEKKDHIEYQVSFTSKRTMLGFLAGAIHDNEGHDPGDTNKLTLSLPRDILLELNAKTQMGRYDFDLSGLAVQSVNMEAKMGDFYLRMEEPNQVPMEDFKFISKMGDVRVYDFQNYGFDEAEVNHKMGSMRVTSSGPMMEDAKLHVGGRMGEIRVVIPENARLDSSASAFMGERRVPRSEPAETENAKTLRLSGGITMGEFRVVRRKPGSTDGRDLVREVRRNGVESLVADLRKTFEESPDHSSVEANQINSLGYRFLGRGLKEESIEVFKLNVEFHPDYTNGYDSLGEAYYRNRDWQPAIECFTKVLERQPGDERAQSYLRRINQKMEKEAAENGDSEESAVETAAADKAEE